MYSIKSENEVGFLSLKRKKNLDKQMRNACRNIKQEELNNSEELKAISIKKKPGNLAIISSLIGEWAVDFTACHSSYQSLVLGCLVNFARRVNKNTIS